MVRRDDDAYWQFDNVPNGYVYDPVTDTTNIAVTGPSLSHRSIDDYWQHNLSASYSQDTWGFTVGVSNVASNRVRVDSGDNIGGRNGLITGGRYDVTGRKFFARVTKAF